MTLHIVPITLRDAQAYVEQHHRHHGPPRGHLWSIGATDDSGQLVGVAIVGRPVARNPHPLARPQPPLPHPEDTMTDLVPADQIEQIVGIQRHPYRHYARAVTAEQTVYILHSQACRDHTPDLRTCIYSRALDRGIDAVSDEWEGYHDSPQRVALYDGWLVPWAWLDAQPMVAT